MYSLAGELSPTILFCDQAYDGSEWSNSMKYYLLYIVLCSLAHHVFCSMPVLQSCVFSGW